MPRGNAKANPTPSRTTHNTFIEVIWTIVPVIILVAIAVPSFKLLFLELTIPPSDVTVKATGKQWYWSYSYPDSKFEFDSLMLKDNERKADQPRLLAVDEDMVIPANTTVRIIGTGADSMHGWTVWGFGIKKTVIPGRINEGWINVPKEGIYFGQCSQICGNGHSYMPIAVRVVSKPEFDKWVEQKKKAAGLAPEQAPTTDFASATVPANR